jgi:uncharacterized protein (DUF433 family)
MIASPNHLGIGIYTPAEAAFYARVSPRMMTRWVFGDSAGKPVIQRQQPESSEKIVTFLDFVQTLAVREVRHRHGLPLQRIRQGVDEARQRYGIPYPLAQEHCIFLFSDQKGKGHGHIVIRLEGDDEDVETQFVQLTGHDKGNLLFRQIVEMFLSDLTFDATTKLASCYRPMTEGVANILIDPHRRFGEPVVEPSGYTVEALWHSTNTEGSFKAAAEACGVTVEEVLLANKYYDILDNRTV